MNYIWLITSVIVMNIRGHAAFQRFAATEAKHLRILSQWYEKCVQHNLELVHKQSQNDGAHGLFTKSADGNSGNIQ